MFEHLKGKRLLFLGAIRALCEPVKIAKEMGIYTIVIDYLPNSPAKKVADKSYLISTTDIDAVVELCKNEKVDGIFTAFIDSMLPYAREICDRLGLPFYASKEQIQLSLDKNFFKATCRKFGVPVPNDYTEMIAQNGFHSNNIVFPVIVKPIDSSGGRGIRICNNAEELQSAYEYALSISPSKNVLVEEYVVGDEVTATYTMKDGEISLSCFKDKLLSHDHENITSQSDVLFCPSCYLPLYMSNVNEVVIDMLKGMHATDGSVFFQGIATKERIVLFECGYRPNGAHDYRHISYINGINYLKMMIAHALTGRMEGYDLTQDSPNFSEYILTYNLWAHGGVINSLSGLDDVLKLDNVVLAEYVHDVGDEIIDNNTLSQRVFRAVIKEKDINKIRDTVNQIQSTVKVINQYGENMLYTPFDANRLIERYISK
ncbi:MAG: ATP-grasp domain-containing protein [Clostridia bacterium]|nr:ATP-grasp domain-containing protein [Clostridia bacterium]